MHSPSLKTKFVTGIFWLAGTKALGQAITWVITIFVMRLLAPHDYGLMGMATLFTSFLLLFSELGLGAAVVQRKELSASQISSIAWAIVLTNVALFIAVLAAAPFAAAYFREPKLANVIRVLGAMFVVSGIGTTSAQLLAREMAFQKTSRAELGGNLAGAGVTLALAATGFGVWSLVTGYVTQVLVINSLYCVFRRAPLLGSFSLAGIRGCINFGFQVACSRFLSYVASNADFMVVGRLLGTVQLGYYNLAFQFASLPIDKGISIVTQVAFPLFSARQTDNQTLRRHYLKLISVVALVTCPIFFGLYAVSADVVRVLLTPKWIPAILPLKILCLASWLRAIASLNAPLVFAKGHPRIMILNSLLQAVVMPASFYVGARYGLAGVSMVWIVVWPALAAVITLQTLRLIDLPVSRYLASLKHPLAGSILMMLVVLGLQRNLPLALLPVVKLALVVLTGAIVYVGYIGLWNRGAIWETIDLVRSLRTRSAKREELATPAATVIIEREIA